LTRRRGLPWRQVAGVLGGAEDAFDEVVCLVERDSPATKPSKSSRATKKEVKPKAQARPAKKQSVPKKRTPKPTAPAMPSSFTF
jgi:hypothetical protein